MNSLDQTPRVLVLLATCNGAKWIEEQLASIVGQTGAELEIIASDDASTDETRNILASYGKSVTTIFRETPSGSAAQNFFSLIRAVDAAEFDLVAFSDQDDVWHDDKLLRAARMLESTGSAGYSSATTAFWLDGRRRVLGQNPVVTRADFLFEGAGQGCTFVLTRDFYRKAREFLMQHETLTRDLHYHDWALYALARAWQQRWTFDPVPTVRYRQHQQNDTGAKLSLAGASARLERIVNGWYRRQIAGIVELVAAANPSNPTIQRWGGLLSSSPGIGRRFNVAAFCLRNGRRKWIDEFVLVTAALMGWI